MHNVQTRSFVQADRIGVYSWCCIHFLSETHSTPSPFFFSVPLRNRRILGICVSFVCSELESESGAEGGHKYGRNSERRALTSLDFVCFLALLFLSTVYLPSNVQRLVRPHESFEKRLCRLPAISAKFTLKKTPNRTDSVSFW